MKKILYILLHPIEYYMCRKYAERIVLLSMCCMYREIDDPCIYDVDALEYAMQEFLDVMHYCPSSVAELGNAKKMLFWHLLVSKFAHLSFPREEITRLVRMNLDEVLDNTSICFDTSIAVFYVFYITLAICLEH